MANRAVVVDLLLRTTQFTSGLRRASHDMSSETTNMETKTKALQMQIGLLGVGMVTFAAIAVRKWAEFDKAMARTEATGGEAAKRIDELNEAAKSDEVIELGYNAIQASDAIYELVKAGVSATDIIGGGMAGAMALAAAETMDASESAAIMASALTQFNLTGEQSAHVADLIVAAAGKAQGSAHDLGFALKQSGLVANQFGLSIEETTGTLALFASAGLIGSDAGTSLRTMLLHLAGPSTKAAKLMEEIGLEVYGANGNMVSMEELADNLQSSLGKLSEEQRNQALATIFGADATRAASLLYREGGDAVEEWIGKVDDSGYALEVARKRMDNLSGDVTKLSATWDRSMIEMGQSADAPLRAVVQGITNLIDWFGALDPAIQGVIMALTGGGGLAILATLGIAQIVSALGTLQAGLVATGVITQATATKMATAFGKVTKAIGLVGAAVGIAFTAFTIFQNLANATKISVDELAESYDVAAGKFSDSATQIAAAKVAESFDWLKEAQTGFGSLAEMARALEIPLDDVAQAMIGNEAAVRRVLEVTDKFAPGAEGAADAAERLGLETFNATVAAGHLEKAIAQNGEVTDEAIQKALDLAEAEGQTGSSAGELEGQVGALNSELDALGVSTAAVTAAEIEAQKAHEDYISAIVDSFTSFFGLGDVYQGVIDGQKALAESAAEESKSTKDSWEDFYDGVSVSAADYIAELEAQVLAQEEWAGNLISLTERAKAELPANMQVAAQEMINELRNLGPEGAAQVALLESMTATELAAVVELFNRQGVAAGEEWAGGVEAVENPEVAVDDEAAKEDLTNLLYQVEDLEGEYRVGVSVSVSGFSALDALQTKINNVITQRGVGVVVPRAKGGSVQGPGTGTSDSIPALLSNGEHVLTADEVQKAGGQDAIYRMRSAIQSGLLRFAGGGAVSVNGRPLSYWQSAIRDPGEILRLRMQIRDLEAEVSQKSGRGTLERQKAWYDLAEARKELADALYANELNRKMPIDDRIGYSDAKIGYSKDIQRGEFSQDLSGGLSGARNTFDRIRDNVLPHLSGTGQANLATALTSAEKAAEKLYVQLDGVDEKLGEATDKAEDLRNISESVQNRLTGGFSLSGTTQTAAVNPFTGQVTGGGAGGGMLRAAQQYASKVKTFAGKLQALADKGFAGVILQEIAEMGVDAGIPAADALLGLNLADTKSLNAAYADMASFGGRAGQAVTEGFYKGGLAAADGLVKGLEDQKSKVQQAIMDMAMAMQDALKKALGIASPARKPRALMSFVGQGIALGLEDQKGIVADASARLGSAVMVGLGSGSYGFSGSASGAEGAITAVLSDEQVERLAVAFETGNVRNINRATAQKNRKMELTYGARGR